MTTHRAPKQWSLSKTETVNSFENWRQNLVYTLSLDPAFSPYLADDCTWLKKSKASPLRGFENDEDPVPVGNRHTAQQKVNTLELLLGQIANYCPVIARNSIIKNSTSLSQVWQTIRLHYGFQSSGAQFLDICDIRLQGDERPEDLFQRLSAFIEDNLLRKDGGISHNNETVTDDEDLTPTLENFIVATWLRLIHNDLPRLVKQRYGTELRSRTLSSIKPEISQALDSLLEELRSSEDVRVLRSSGTNYSNNRPSRSLIPNPKFTPASRPNANKICPLCKQSGRPNTNHFLSMCQFLPDSDRRFMVKARQISDIIHKDDDVPVTEDIQPDESHPKEAPNLSRLVTVRRSPYMHVFHQHHALQVTLDSGATANMMRLSTAKQLEVVIDKSTQSARQADGSSPLHIVGETRLVFTRDNKSFSFEGLVVENLDVEILAGTPFMEHNDIAVRPARNQILLGDGTIYLYGSEDDPMKHHTIRRALVLRSPSTALTVWPDDFVELQVPDKSREQDCELAIESRPDTSAFGKDWPPPNVYTCIAGRVRIPNDTGTPLVFRKNEQFCQAQPVSVYSMESTDNQFATPSNNPHSFPAPSIQLHSSLVKLPTDGTLSSNTVVEFQSLLKQYDQVFDPKIPGYNGKSGPFQAQVHMGPVEPPQRRGRLPQYSTDKLIELQRLFDEYEMLGVFVRPEDVGISVEYVNPSFLIKKPTGGFRLVTAFADVGRYTKPQPSLMPNVDSVLRQIGAWKFIITTDLTKAFYQIPLAHDSMKYCGVVTPYRGIRAYARCAMGMPGSEAALEELMCRVLGHLIEAGTVARLADDLYCGGNTESELLTNWELVLHALATNGLRLSASKTLIAPATVTILGWIWSNGQLKASPHRVAALAGCDVPSTVKALRSFIGAYKVLSRVLPQCASIIAPLDTLQAGRQSRDKLTWSDELLESFKRAQSYLTSHKSIAIPRPTDYLWIVTDGAVKGPGIGATLYTMREDKPLLAGFFSAKLRDRQISWLPCEIEALSIAVATAHFSPYIIQSTNKACVLTDSKPCVQAYEKLCRGQFSASPRVATFLSTVSRYQMSVRHFAGSANIPSDFSSRNAPPCPHPTCQVCSFVNTLEDSVVQAITVQDVLSGLAKLPFTSRPAWLSIQSECADLRRAHSHLKQGTRPSKKLTKIGDVKRYLNIATVSKDGLLVVRRDRPLQPPRECIIVPRHMLDGLLTSIHLQLSHPSAYQLKQIFNRFFYALDMDKAIQCVSTNCHQCASLKTIPHTVTEQSSSHPPSTIGSTFAADVMKRERQLIFVLRECVTSYTKAKIIDSERHECLRDALVELCVDLRPLCGPPAVVRTDPAPGFISLVNDDFLQSVGVHLEIGRIKNKNKNPVAEKAIQELQIELLKVSPARGAVTNTTLSIALSSLNSRIRSSGISAREMYTQRDQFSNEQLPISDQQLILDQHANRLRNHPLSELSKCPRNTVLPTPSIDVGDIVYLFSDRNKSAPRDRYIVTSCDGSWCNIQKFRGSQLRSTSYRVKTSELYKATETISTQDHVYDSDQSDDVEINPTPTVPPPLPAIPLLLSEPFSFIELDNESADHTSSTLAGDTCVPTHSDVDIEDTCVPTHSDVKLPRRPRRQRTLPKRFKDYHMDMSHL